MTNDILERSEKFLTGELSVDEHHPVIPRGASTLYELGDGLAFVESFANVTAVVDGNRLLMVDAGGVVHASQVHQAIRDWTDAPLETAVYTHGHVDHVFSVPLFEAEDRSPAPTVIAHERVVDRFDRYRLTHGYNGIINQRQFRLAGPFFPSEFRYPDRTHRDGTQASVGSVGVELHHDRGETDDHTWAWIPDRKVLCTGDLFIWVSPNCGNPQKAQRYPAEWAAALRRMAGLGAELMLPGHGLPIAGADRITRVLSTAAEYLESLVEQTLALMNAGARLDEIVHTVKVSDELSELPWLRPIYDEPEFIVRNLWRLYGGWYDGNPSTLKPAPEADLATELANLAGGSSVLADRARVLAQDGQLRLAGHLAELAALASPVDPAVHRVRAHVFEQRVEAEPSLMARGVFVWAAHESAERAQTGDDAVDGDGR